MENNNNGKNTIFLNLLEKMYGTKIYYPGKNRNNYNLSYLEFLFSNKKLRLVAPRKDNKKVEEFGGQYI